jgi:preprotein translocase subunit SecD
MINIPRWKVIAILLVCVLGFVYSVPNVVGGDAQNWMKENLPSFLPTKTVNLGLDLQGGAHLLVEVDVASVVKERSEGLEDALRPELRGEKIGYRRLGVLDGGVRVTLRDTDDTDAARKILRHLDEGLEVDVKGDTLEARFTEDALKAIKDKVIEQSIEIVRRRIDETGTNEPVIQRQGEDRILVQLPGVGDPQYIKDLLQKTAKLAFHLVEMGADPSTASRASTLVLPMAEDPLQTLVLVKRPELQGDMLTNAAFAQDQNGQPAVSFRFNAIGTKKFCTLSRENVNRLFAIVLDGEIISAPVIREPICGGSGQISGSFSVKEASDLALLLRAGALPADLHFVEERTVGPSLGADSVEAGKIAAGIGLVLVLVFMMAMYGLFGVFASGALVVNIGLIFALLSGLQATLTLPGIAGIVLTIGMAVDANVLIFERIREEVKNGRSMMAAIDTGYARAMSTIIDSNLTSLIAAFILFSFGTGPVKGFAVTLGIGIVTSMFSAIMVTRLMIVAWLKYRNPKALPI